MKKELQRFLGGVHTQIAVRQEGRIHTLPVYDRDGKGGFFQHEKVNASVPDTGTAGRSGFLEFLKFIGSSIRRWEGVQKKGDALAFCGSGSMGVGGQDVDGQGFRELDKKFPYTISDPAVFSNGAIIVQKQMVDGKGLITWYFNLHF